MTNPRCGGSHSVPVSEGASFFCHPSLKGRYVTIRDLRQPKVKQPFTLCEVEVYSESRGMKAMIKIQYTSVIIMTFSLSFQQCLTLFYKMLREICAL